ncbi:ACR3 family arsenite efflux pump ArsB [Luteibacter sp. Sphag1AF]|uniref:arsenic resistance protein n=1 Tax=Luteibacter sp. Sphag1AF TaxID=2587031 RepID=UPI00160B3401|nr:arsenic resistance protein [Luteibacter sp. Sphag1AF]MBB3228634.1 ACR3 family arsenite efflux pump ArsB [Luteibacter sp. Sphag1AF]
MQQLRDALEGRQIVIYFCAVALAAVVALLVPATSALESLINPALALMLYVTFLQVPMAELRRAFVHFRFLAALLAANFTVVPLLVAGLIWLVPAEPMIRLGVLLVLLAPCIDYVVTFAHLGQADARLLLAATPVLLFVQMVVLPGYLAAFLGSDAAQMVKAGPFLHAFLWLIVVPLLFAAATRFWAARRRAGERVASLLGLIPVPATALVLFVVVASVVPQLGLAGGAAWRVVPVYAAFAVLAPSLGWTVARLVRLEPAAARAVAFSAGTRNSLVVLPLALAVPGAMPVLPAVIVTQTLVELVSELVYVRVISRLGRSR